jgi:hypothetical protein
LGNLNGESVCEVVPDHFIGIAGLAIGVTAAITGISAGTPAAGGVPPAQAVVSMAIASKTRGMRAARDALRRCDRRRLGARITNVEASFSRKFTMIFYL